MKNKFFFFIGVTLLGLCLLSCNSTTKKKNTTELPKTSEYIERHNPLKIGEEIAFKEYGNVIKNELPLKAKLVGDSVWVIEGTLAKGADGGTVYIEIRRGDNELLKITHYK
jgi:NTF2 fold immunity protein